VVVSGYAADNNY